MTSDPTKNAERLADEYAGRADDAGRLARATKAAIAALREEIEDWRGRLATQCGETLAARYERDIATRRVETLEADLIASQRKVESLTIKTPREQAMRETIHGQGLSMVAMGKELCEKDDKIKALEAEIGRLVAAHVKLQGDYNVATAPPNPTGAPPAADHTERAREDEHADLAHEIMCEAREACGVYHTTAAGKVRRALAAADHTERAREINRTAIEILDPVSAQLPATIWDALHDGITAALTAAERAGAEKMRALDEAVIEAVRKYKRSQSDFKSFTEQGARDASAELDHALAARDVATDGEGR